MEKGHFYFIQDAFFEEFESQSLMSNKEMTDGNEHNRPSYFAFQDKKTSLYWLIPISSKIEKYHKLYKEKTSDGKICDTIVFGKVLGFEKAFLIQNMCPITSNYILNEYLDKNNKAVMVDKKLEQELISKARKVLALHKKGLKLLFADISFMEKKLLNN